MSFYVSIIGIDGSGKSTLAPLLSHLAAAELGITAVTVGDDLWGYAPEEDLFRPGFVPDGTPFAARMAQKMQRFAKKVNAHRLLYPPAKLAQFVLQERVVNHLSRQYRPDLILSDGNLLLSAAGRAVNYAQDGTVESGAALLEEMHKFVFAERPSSSKLSKSIPGLAWMRRIARWDRRRNLNLLRLPDAVIFLDVTPEEALDRLRQKHTQLDPHENLHDLVQAQAMYRQVVAYCQRQLGEGRTAVIDTTRLSVAQTMKLLLSFIRRLVNEQSSRPASGILGAAHEPLTEPKTIARKVLNKRYIFRYLLPNLLRGGARELLFPFSPLGRQFLKEGYSANVMQAIYARRNGASSLMNRPFLNYPLHQAVYQRWRILNLVVEAQLRQRLINLQPGDKIRILSAPSGFAEDVFSPLIRLKNDGWLGLRQIQLTASDLDPYLNLEKTLPEKADKIGIQFEFLQGDITSDVTRRTLVQSGPFDLVLFIGLSSWISKPDMLNHLKMVRRDLLNLDGTLIMDCFMPGAYALSGKYVGYQANYFSPDECQSLLNYCGFDHRGISWMHSPNGLNHVCIAREKKQRFALAVRSSRQSTCDDTPINLSRQLSCT